MFRHLGIAAAFAVAAFAAPAFALGVGDAAPEITPTATWNNPESRTKLSDFQGEYVHLVFWATW